MKYMEESIIIEDSSQKTRIERIFAIGGNDKTPKFNNSRKGMLKSQLLLEDLERKDGLEKIKDSSIRHSINR